LLVEAQKFVPNQIRSLEVHELLVSEILWRLTDPSELLVDVGCNIGYMASLFRPGRSDQSGT
jgi:hypothetical protein